MTAFVIDDQTTRAELERILGISRQPRAVMAAVGRRGQQDLKKHFLQKDRSEPNRLSSRRSHIWLEVRDSVQNPVIGENDTQVKIPINHPIIAQKIFGGPIRPKNADALTLPVSEEAYGRTARTFEAETGLKLIFARNGRGQGFLGTIRQKGGPLQVEYVLRKQVNQKPDPTALPDMQPGSPFVQGLLRTAANALARQIRTDGGEGSQN